MASCYGNRGGSFALFVLFQALTQHIDCSICKQAAILTFDLDMDDDDGPASAEGRSTGV